LCPDSVAEVEQRLACRDFCEIKVQEAAWLADKAYEQWAKAVARRPRLVTDNLLIGAFMAVVGVWAAATGSESWFSTLFLAFGGVLIGSAVLGWHRRVRAR
jgi:hypothetical protein